MCSKAGLSVIDIWQAPRSEFRESWRRMKRVFLADSSTAGQYLLKVKDKDQKEDADNTVSGVS